MIRNDIRCWALATITLAAVMPALGGLVNLSELDLSKATAGWGTVQANTSCTKAPLKIAGENFANGVGTHAASVMFVRLAGGSEKFQAICGVDDDTGGNGKGSVTFLVFGDGKQLFKSGVKHGGEKGEVVDVNVAGVKMLTLLVTDADDGIDFDHADWANARFEVSGARPELVAVPADEKVILTPQPGPAPRINGPKIYGARPGHPFLYRIPCTGERPVHFSAQNLPASLKLDPDAGIVSGTTPAAGEYAIVFTASNAKGKSARRFKLVAGETLSLTPSMGFNDWYAYYNRVTDAMMRQAADALVASGMADAGYQYVNIDDCWLGSRDANGEIQGNKNFEDLKALADYIHGKGLKAGLYTSPGPQTCAGYTGAFGHEAQDARRFADWGFDFLKYDWCSYDGIAAKGNGADATIPNFAKGSPTTEVYEYPYRKMGDLLKQQNRDIVLNLCQYGLGDVWKWGKETGGQSWRTGGDLGMELHRILDIAARNAELGAYNGPGGWNDPDYLQVGWIGTAYGMAEPTPCPLTPTEQYSFMSLWCLLPAPLFYSGDMTHLDAFTLNILCNPEVIDVDQDPLGKSARLIKLDGGLFLMVKDLEDGSKAVGLCNRGEVEIQITAKWSDLGLSGKQSVRDLWREKDLGDFDDQFSTLVPRHGVALVKIQPKNQTAER